MLFKIGMKFDGGVTRLNRLIMLVNFRYHDVIRKRFGFANQVGDGG